MRSHPEVYANEIPDAECAHERARLVCDVTVSGLWRVQCPDCALEGPPSGTTDEARYRWALEQLVAPVSDIVAMLALWELAQRGDPAAREVVREALA